MTTRIGPPPLGTCLANTQETRVVVHTYGSGISYTVTYEVWRPDWSTDGTLRRCGSCTVNGTAWSNWARYAEDAPHPTKRGRDMGDEVDGSTSDPSRNEQVARRDPMERPTPKLDTGRTKNGVRDLGQRR